MNTRSPPPMPWFVEPALIDHLAAMMRADPDAPGWHVAIAWAAGFDGCVEAGNGPAAQAHWSGEWPTYRTTSASLRLTPPADQLAGLGACLARISQAHCEAVGGPPDGVRYHFDVYPMRTRLSVTL